MAVTGRTGADLSASIGQNAVFAGVLISIALLFILNKLEILTVATSDVLKFVILAAVILVGLALGKVALEGAEGKTVGALFGVWIALFIAMLLIAKYSDKLPDVLASIFSTFSIL